MMKHYSYLFLVLLYCFLNQNAEAAMSEAQMKAAVKMMRNVCQPKNKATDEQIERMHKGDWEQDKNGMCYMHCILNMYKLLTKTNELDYDAAIKTIETQAPVSLQKTALSSVNNCKDSIKTTSDKCVAAHELAKCLYFDDPEHYFLP